MTASRRFLSPILGLLLAGALTLYMNAPSFMALLTVPGYSTLHMGNIEEDRAYYLSRIKEASEGHWLIGNSALYEHRFDVSPNGFIETVTAAIMNVTGLQLATQAVSLGGVETLAVHAASVWEGSLTPEQIEQAGVSPALVRLAAGLESATDLIADVDRALALADQ